MKFTKLFILVLAILCLKYYKAGIISATIGTFFKDATNKAASNIIGKAKQAFLESMDVLFDKKISPMIHEMEATSNRILDHAKDDINAIVNNFKIQIQSLIDDAFKKANEFVDHTIEEIKTNILQFAFDSLNSFEDKIVKDLNSLLDRVDSIIFQTSCSTESLVDKIINEVKIDLPSIPNPFEFCRQELAKIYGQTIAFKFISSLTDSQLYDYKKCKLVGELTEKTNIHAVKAAYRDLEQVAAKLRCASVAKKAIQNERFYLREMGRINFILDTYEGITPL